MQSKVFLMRLNAHGFDENIIHKINQLYDAAQFDTFIEKNAITAVKVHFGERGNDTFIPPWYIRPIIDKIKAKGSKPFITDTNTLYIGSRKNAIDHLQTALEHGYGFATVGAPLIIADGVTSDNYEEIEIHKKHFEKVKIASDIVHAKNMIVISHFKGHMMAGFGGAIKNLGMGCAPAAGKKDQHSARPVSDDEKCTGCGTCISVCPEGAIEIVERKSIIHSELCIGCGECMTHCPEKAITLDWTSELPPFTERMTEYAYGAWKTKQKHIGFISFVINVTPDCDCMSWSGEPIVDNVGIVASLDPIALDKACYDLVNKQLGRQGSNLKNNYNSGEDKFKGVNENSMGELQFQYGESLGMGTQDYELIDLTPKHDETDK